MNNCIRYIVLILVSTFTSFIGYAQTTQFAASSSRPNVLLIVADDLGYADLGAYGGNIRTPNIDALASNGMLFTQFHAAPYCAITRSMLLTGNNNHIVGMPEQGDGFLSDRVAVLPQLLFDSGYHTYQAGKWHLGDAFEHGPSEKGFEHSYTLAHGAGSHFSGTGFFDGGSLYREDGVEIQFPAGEYTTELFTDKLIKYIDSETQSDDPFFVYAAYTSPHWPLQVPEEYLDLYAGEFDQGYDVLREERFNSLKMANIIPENSQLPPRNPDITPWEDLPIEQQRVESRKMELYASMVENLDHHVGRLIDHVKSRGVYDNTLVIFMSDNGAAAEDFYNTGSNVDYIQSNYNDTYEQMGKPGSWISYGPQWAEAGSAPFSRHKGYTREGGIIAPMIISGVGVKTNGLIDRSYVTVMDIAPTILELAGTVYPDDGSVKPMLGESLLSLLGGTAFSAHDEDYVTTFYHRGRAYLREGDWKIVNMDPPFSEAEFALFNLKTDPGEATNLASQEPERFERMKLLWREQRVQMDITLPND